MYTNSFTSLCKSGVMGSCVYRMLKQARSQSLKPITSRKSSFLSRLPRGTSVKRRPRRAQSEKKNWEACSQAIVPKAFCLSYSQLGLLQAERTSGSRDTCLDWRESKNSKRIQSNYPFKNASVTGSLKQLI